MTTLTNSEGLAITYTIEPLTTVLLQLTSSNNCYTSGEHAIIFIKVGSNIILTFRLYISYQPNHLSKLYNT